MYLEETLQRHGIFQLRQSEKYTVHDVTIHYRSQLSAVIEKNII